MKEATLSRPFILALSLNKTSKATAKTNTLDEQVYRCVCDYIGANSNGVIVLTGGEPFLDSRLSEILVLARNRGWPTSVDTRCLFHELPSLDGIQQIRLRLFSLNPNLHNRIACDQQSFQKTTEYAKWLADNYSGEKIMVFPVCRDNYREIAAVLDWCRSLNFIPNFFVVPRQHEYSVDLQDYRVVLQALRELPPEDIIIDVPLLGLSGWSNICPGGRVAMYIGVDGEIMPCPDFPYPICWMGKDIPSTWRTLQEKIAVMNEVCSSCEHFSACGGGCLANKTGAGKDYYCSAMCLNLSP